MRGGNNLFAKKRSDKKLKIAMIGQKRIPSREGGIEVVVEEISTRMVERGHEVTCYNRGGRHVSGSEIDLYSGKEYKGIKLKPVLTIDIRGLAAMSSSFFAAIRAAVCRYDVLHFHAEGPCAMAWIPKLFGKRVVATIHGLDWKRAKWKGFAKRYIKFGEKVAVKCADEIIVLSENLKNYFLEEYGRETVFIPNGINAQEPRSANIITEKWGLNKNDYILFLGRIVPEKGIKYLIDAFLELKTDKKLVVAGGSSDSEEFFDEMMNSMKQDDRIIFTGFVQGEELNELYSNAYIFVLPSDLEGMPISLLEAMSYGDCCLVSDIAECAEVVEDKAVTFKKGNVSDLKEKLQMLCENPDKVEKYQREAKDYVCNKYDWDAVVDKTLQLYYRK